MIEHYIKLALRNLWKYRTQSLISIVGLAVGFVCFALANLWIHYEMTYDTDRPDADRIYAFYMQQEGWDNIMRVVSYPMVQDMAKRFPELEGAYAVNCNRSKLENKKEGRSAELYGMDADSTLIDMLGNVRLLEGSWDFLHDRTKVALTEEAAVALFGSTDVLGQEVTNEGGEPFTVCAVLNTQPRHSNFYFGYWHLAGLRSANAQMYRAWLKLRKDVDKEALLAKLDTFINEALEGRFSKVQLLPLSEFHYSEVNMMYGTTVHFYYLIIFSVTGVMIILCALLNYLSLFVVRMRSRYREVELRRTCGSSVVGLLKLFAVEYLPVLLFSGLIGMAILELFLPEFRRISDVSGGIYGESLLYYAAVLLFSYVVLLPFFFPRRRVRTVRHRRLFGRVSIWLQLTTGILFVFCVSTMMKQLHFLRSSDIGFERTHTAVFDLSDCTAEEYAAATDFVDRLPYITETLKGQRPLFPYNGILMSTAKEWDGRPSGSEQTIDVQLLLTGVEYIRFYGLRLLKGDMLKSEDTDKALINETLAKELGLADPVGKNIKLKKNYVIAGVLRDAHITPPTLPVSPMLFANTDPELMSMAGLQLIGVPSKCILLKYRPGSWTQLRTDVNNWFAEHNITESWRKSLTNVEDEYNKNLHSEEMLMSLLGLAALVCILTAGFGIFSLVSLSCQQRRKEIAIRKINGARIANILGLFVREYLLLLLLAAVIAFPVGYILMKRWLQSYTLQTPISWWLYAAIFAGTAGVVALCIGWRVWQAARSNPAETIKSE
jgi:ABC-type lipoprotein release transport system permease subunit